jgi:hypothetical protein
METRHEGTINREIPLPELPFYLTALLEKSNVKGTESISGLLDRIFGKVQEAKK